MKRRKGIEDHTDGVDKKIRKQGKGRKTLKAKYVYIVCRSIVIKVLSIASIFLFVKTKSDYCTYALITSLATGGNYLFNIWHVRKSVKLSFTGINLKRHIAPILILAVSVILESVYGKIDTTMLGILSGDTSTGLYSYAHKTVTLITGACAAIRRLISS